MAAPTNFIIFDIMIDDDWGDNLVIDRRMGLTYYNLCSSTCNGDGLCAKNNEDNIIEDYHVFI